MPESHKRTPVKNQKLNILPENTTLDYFFKKKVIVLQKKNGYRFSIDAPILASFLPHRRQNHALEIGTGCGIVALLALFKNKFQHIFGLEIQKQLSQISEMNANKNHLSKKFTAINGDFNLVYKDFTGIDWIFSNPPYLKPNQGKMSNDREIRIAKTETKLNLQQLLKKSYTILSQKGKLCLIFPYSRYHELTKTAQEIGFFITRIQIVFSFGNGNPVRFLVQLSKNMDSVKEIPPLVIFKKINIYTQKMEKILIG